MILARSDTNKSIKIGMETEAVEYSVKLESGAVTAENPYPVPTCHRRGNKTRRLRVIARILEIENFF